MNNNPQQWVRKLVPREFDNKKCNNIQELKMKRYWEIRGLTKSWGWGSLRHEIRRWCLGKVELECVLLDVYLFELCSSPNKNH